MWASPRKGAIPKHARRDGTENISHTHAICDSLLVPRAVQTGVRMNYRITSIGKLASLREERIRTIEAYLSVGYVTNCCVHDRLVLNSFGRRRLQMKRDLGCICHAHNNPSRTQRTSKLLWCESFPPVGGLISWVSFDRLDPTGGLLAVVLATCCHSPGIYSKSGPIGSRPLFRDFDEVTRNWTEFAPHHTTLGADPDAF